MKLPLIAIVGAPNVGKSRLFNRLTGRRRSIVHDRPGITRDRVEGICEWDGRRFRLLDTGGLLPEGQDEITTGVKRQVLKGIQEAALLVFVVDGRAGLTPLDQGLATLFRKASRPVVLAVNKIDAAGQEGRMAEFFRLGFSDSIAVSAEEGRGAGDLLEAILRRLPESSRPAEESPSGEGPAIRLAVVGRPNVGKSTLFNRLIGEERAVVSSVPGTTRDPVDSEFVHQGRRYRIVDTAGLRRRARAQEEEVEMQSVARSLAALRQADLVVVLMDASEPATHQDLAVLGTCRRVRRGVVVALNKVDRLPRGGGALVNLREQVRERLRFAESPPIVMLSALQGEGFPELLEVLERLVEESGRRIPTPDLNRALQEAVRRRSPSAKDRIARLLYITQTGTSPPSFVVFTNGVRLKPSYRRYLARSLRQAFGFSLTPVSLRFRERSSRP